jgi:hypothetical protein
MSTAARVCYQVQRLRPGAPPEAIDTRESEQQARDAALFYRTANPSDILRIVRYEVHTSEVTRPPPP